MISQNWGTPDIDLFASRTCHQFHTYMVSRPDLHNQATDALTDRKSSLKSQGRGINNDFGNSKLACTTLVQSNPRSVHNRASAPAPISETFGRSQGTSTSSSVEQDFETNGQEIFRKNLVEKGISNTVANLISNSRRSVTKSNYQSAWKKWVTWFSEGQINPVTCSINFVLNFLAIYLKTNIRRRGAVV